MSRPLLLDLFCGAGGAAMGYHRAGFDVIGVDIDPQPNYPFEFVQADAMSVAEHLVNCCRRSCAAYPFLAEVRAIHASPPCQRYSVATRWRGDPASHPDLFAPTRALLAASGLPWVVENVPGAPFEPDVVLCGTIYGLPIRRHRWFLTSWPSFDLRFPCEHRPEDYSFDHGGKQPESVYRDAMGCDWMTVVESRNAIPPAYTEHIGRQLLEYIGEAAA